MRGLALFVEGSHRNSLKKEGTILEISKIPHIRGGIQYAMRRDLGVMYISISRGLIFVDDIVTPSPRPLYLYNSRENKIWSEVVSMQIEKVCLDFLTNNVYLMVSNASCYKNLIESMKKRGIRVNTPWLNRD